MGTDRYNKRAVMFGITFLLLGGLFTTQGSPHALTGMPVSDMVQGASSGALDGLLSSAGGGRTPYCCGYIRVKQGGIFVDSQIVQGSMSSYSSMTVEDACLKIFVQGRWQKDGYQQVFAESGECKRCGDGKIQSPNHEMGQKKDGSLFIGQNEQCEKDMKIKDSSIYCGSERNLKAYCKDTCTVGCGAAWWVTLFHTL